MLGSLGVGAQGGGDTVVGWVVLSEPLGDAPFHDRGDPLFDAAGRFGCCVPYGGEAGHDIGCGDLVHPFFPKVRIGVGVEG